MYAQGIMLMREVSKQFTWKHTFGNVALVRREAVSSGVNFGLRMRSKITMPSTIYDTSTLRLFTEHRNTVELVSRTDVLSRLPTFRK